VKREEAYRELSVRMPGRVFLREPMDRHTSMGVGGAADCLVFPRRIEEVRDAAALLLREGIPFLPLGNGTNLIVREKGYRGVFLSLRDLDGMNLHEEEGKPVLTAGAGAPLSRAVLFTVTNALEGLEFCAGIPGTVGGGIRMNAGAWGVEIKDVLRSIRFLNGSATVRTEVRERLPFRYRSLDLPGGTVILEGDFSLARGEERAVRERVEGFLEKRRQRHPLEYRSAGSIFRNPPEGPAGLLIDRAGLKGLRVGGASVSEKHGNFIVNTGGAGAEDVIALMRLVRERVSGETGVVLEPEVKIVGEEGWEPL
jgi:UDP-N-acetylmuramate dehydrogenase